MKLGILIPCTSKNQDWKTIEESFLYKLSIKTFLITNDKEHDSCYYIGYDKNDPIFDNEENQKKLKKFISVMKNASIQFYEMQNVAKGHVTVMWNQLAKKAYDDGCDYFFQCGDDIEFHTKGWVNDCIEVLKNNNDIGLAGPINNNSQILTQSFVSRKHIDIFGFYFPEEIKNWFCDDWINEMYKPDNFFPLTNHYCANRGGEPRYHINNDPNIKVVNSKCYDNKTYELYQKLKFNSYKIIERDQKIIKKYLK